MVKTTLLKQLIAKYDSKVKKCIYLDCDLLRVKQILKTENEKLLEKYLSDYDILAIDEAQNIENIGQILKIIHDVFPEKQLLVTGSSSFDLANKTGFTLVGRSRSFTLYPLSISEIKQSEDIFSVDAKIENFLRFGFYSEITKMSEKNAIDELENIVNGYLYKDILSFEVIHHSDQIVKLLQCLALKIGSEVSF